MADRATSDESMDEAVGLIATAATSEASVAAARRFADPVVDAFSVALGSVHEAARAPDPRVERDLSPVDAVAAASGVMTSRLSTQGRWWSELPGPAVTTDGDRAAAILPRGSGAVAVQGGTRTRSAMRTGSRAQDRAHRGETVAITGPLPPGASWISLIRWSIRRRRSQLWTMLILSVVAGCVGLLLPIATTALFGYAVPSGDRSLAFGILMAFALGSIGGALLIIARNVIVIRLRDASDARLSPGIVAHLMRLPMPFFRRMSQGEVLNRTLSVENARELVDDGVVALVLTSAFGIVNLAFLLRVDVPLGLGMSVVVLIVVGVVALMQRRARKPLEHLLEERSRSDAELMSLIEAMVPIRVGGAESRALARWSVTGAAVISSLRRRLETIDASWLVLVAAPILLNAILVAAVLVAGRSFTAAGFMGAYVAVVQLTIAMGLLAQNIVTVSEVGPTLARMVPITSEPVERPGPVRAPGPLLGRLQFTDVVFGYDPDQPPLLDGVSFTVEPGEFVAIVGPSGSGKSTILRLILGFEVPWSGVVSYDGQDLADLDIAAVRRQMGTVLQSSTPFGTTYRECVCGPLRIDDDRLWEVFAEAGLEAEVRSRGLDAPIGDRGGAISGGQRQRLMIARALASDPRIILLDEATSALDNVTQEIVMRSILGRPVTRIAIAHRLTTVERADRILVVSAGQIVEEGAPDELLRTGGHFARLAARQSF